MYLVVAVPESPGKSNLPSYRPNNPGISKKPTSVTRVPETFGGLPNSPTRKPSVIPTGPPITDVSSIPASTSKFQGQSD